MNLTEFSNSIDLPANCKLYLLERYQNSGWENDPDKVDHICYDDLKNPRHDEDSYERLADLFLVAPDLLSGSDYLGASYHKSNHRSFLRMYGDQPGAFDCPGRYGTYSVMIALKHLTDDMRDTLNGISDYPVIDDDDRQELEDEIFNQSWEGWLKRDFLHNTASRFNIEVEEYDETKLQALFWVAEDERGSFIIEAGCSGYCDVAAVVKRVEFEEFIDALTKWESSQGNFSHDDFQCLVESIQEIDSGVDLPAAFKFAAEEDLYGGDEMRQLLIVGRLRQYMERSGQKQLELL